MVTHLDSEKEPQSSLKPQLDQLIWQGELERIDREWEQQRETFVIVGRHGQRRYPDNSNTTGNVVGVSIVVIFLWFWLNTAHQMGAPPIFPLFGVFVLVAVVVGTAMESQKAGEYNQAKADYEKRRSEHLARRP
jgi:hypothetical protein